MSSPTLKIGDVVYVPGSMHGTLKYLGPVQGKKGIFAGVQLAAEFSSRGKNSGDVEGRYYFKTSVPGSGIFLPSEKAEKRQSRDGGAMGAPGTPAGGERAGIAPLGGFNQGGRTPGAAGLPKPNFSQSIGPGAMMRSSSPMGGTNLKAPVRRESLPRPGSPLRKPNTSTIASTPGTVGRLATPRTRPSLGLNKSVNGTPGAGLKSPGPRQSSTLATNRFGQSLRASTRGGMTPLRAKGFTPHVPRSETSISNTTSGTSPLGPESAFDEEEEESFGQSNEVDLTPTPAAGRSIRNVTSSSTASTVDLEENRRLKEQLVERDRQLNEQAASINDMQASLSELSQLMTTVQQGGANPEGDQELPRDAQELRAALKEKNERIKALTAEFDANRADFRSTIDTLEMASTETERVYERRVEDLLEEIRMYQEKNEDVESVAQQFKQLEELVQELEEGLEDARRGEAEARGEVEFLRGEVERGRSEMRREKERNRAGDRLNGIDTDDGGISSEEFEELQLKIDQKDNEIRGLKAIIQNLNDTAAERSPDREKTPKANGNGFHFGHGHSKTMSTNTVVSLGQVGYDDTADHLQQQIRDLESLLDSKGYSDEQLREGVNKLRQSVQFGASGSKVHIPGLGIKQHSRTNSNQLERSNSAGTARQEGLRSTSAMKQYQPTSGFSHRRKDTGIPEYADVNESPVTEEFEDAHEEHESQSHQPGKKMKESPSISSQTDTSSASPWCELCEESGHDILHCSNMGFDSNNNHDESSTNRTSQPISSSRPLTGSSATGSMHSFRDNLRRSRESPHPPPTTAVPLLPGSNSDSPSKLNHSNRSTATTNSLGMKRGGQDIDRPAPLSMNASRHNSTDIVNSNNISSTTNNNNTHSPITTTKSSDPTTKKLIDQFPSPSPNPSPLHSPSNPTFPTTSTSTSITQPTTSNQPTPRPSSNNNNNKPTLLEGTGPQAGMLGGRTSGIIDSDKWCALCERDGHDSVDCPLEIDEF